jgi:hypothetical protein
LSFQDSPDQGVLYLIRGLLNILQNYTWDMHNDTKIRLYMHVLSLLSAMSQESYAYHVDNSMLFFSFQLSILKLEVER